LRGPKFFSIAANHERRFLFLLLLFLSHEIYQCIFALTIFEDTVREPCPRNATRSDPKETSFARQLLIFLNFAKIFRKSSHVKAFAPLRWHAYLRRQLFAMEAFRLLAKKETRPDLTRDLSRKIDDRD
jgi:hypothetical protein